MKFTVLVLLAALVAISGCITPTTDVVYINQTPNVVYITTTETPTTDPCSGVVCIPTCIGYDLYSTMCIGGYCVENALIRENSLSCGYIPPEPEPVPTATPDHNPRPSPSATPPPTPPPVTLTYPPATSEAIDIECPIYSGDVSNNGRITDIRVTPDLLVVGDDITIDVDVLNTGPETTVYAVKCDVRRGWMTIGVGDTKTQSFTNRMSEAGDYTWYINLYYDSSRPGVDDVLLQNATIDVYAQNE